MRNGMMQTIDGGLNVHFPIKTALNENKNKYKPVFKFQHMKIKNLIR